MGWQNGLAAAASPWTDLGISSRYAVSGNNRLCPAFEGFLPDLGGGGIVLAGSQHNTMFHNVLTDYRGSTGFSVGIVLVITPVANTAGTSDVSWDNCVVLNRLHGNEPADIVVDAESTPTTLSATVVAPGYLTDFASRRPVNHGSVRRAPGRQM